MKINLRVKAIIIGFIVDIGASLVFSIGAAVIVVIVYVAMGKNINTLAADYYSNIPMMAGSLIVGLAFSALGGFVAGHYAKGAEMPNAATVGMLTLLFGLLFYSSLPAWYSLASAVLAIPATCLGGYISKRKNK